MLALIIAYFAHTIQKRLVAWRISNKTTIMQKTQLSNFFYSNFSIREKTALSSILILRHRLNQS